MGNRLENPDVDLTPGAKFKDPAQRAGAEPRDLTAAQINDVRKRLENLAEQSEYFVYFANLVPSVNELLTNLDSDPELAINFFEEFQVAPEALRELFELKALNRVAIEAAMSLHLTNR
jgi:negative regulator of sigma E activity